MDASPVTLDQSNLDRLSDKDKTELRQFIANEQQRTRVQSQTHSLTEMCWKKCVTSTIRSKTLEKGEEACLANCVDRFLDMNIMTAKHLASMRRP
ncbi:mitochondrial import inner membrane translocase subunit tim8 [Grosmannia clavigera kw1407]|uniref:Mitochondrial import inner membrane translocase subunit n=1 Tax=Grosmannia clavigera (strain kw1407 / UAMH 11150) TaxID=655863 RepID=F0XPQ0_GROCL|nr:mitochondrial import inner membrane translocase subunit tim8 [Grosmannia clavigera kw1407]EFX00455.1 mitochondrial import inner membrane translocase subunit tim8 [Grosmannia clavigera kw1407]